MPTLTWEEIDALRDGAEREYQRSEVDVALIGRIDALERAMRVVSERPFQHQDAAAMQAQIDQLVENTTRLKQMVIDLQQQRQPDTFPMVETGPFGPGYVSEAAKLTASLLAARSKDPRTAKRRRAVDSPRRTPMKKKPKGGGKKC